MLDCTCVTRACLCYKVAILTKCYARPHKTPPAALASFGRRLSDAEILRQNLYHCHKVATFHRQYTCTKIKCRLIQSQA